MPFREAPPDSFHHRFLKRLPPCSFAFAYGSAVFRQVNNISPSNMLDYVVAVDDGEIWHEHNIERNPKDYAWLTRNMGPNLVHNLQRNYGAAVHYNTLVKFEDRLVKYGVIDKADLLEDLIAWRYLYTAGRLHKPVLLIQPDKDVSEAMHRNLLSAVNTAVLLMQDSFTKEDLFVVISYLSYMGDFRMKFGEDKNKVYNLVRPNIDEFFYIYRSILQKHDYLFWDETNQEYIHEATNRSRYYLLNSLPKYIRERILLNQMNMYRNRDIARILADTASKVDCRDVVVKAIQHIASPVNRKQSLKGILTAGLWKTARYSSMKLMKMAASWNK